MGYWPAKIASKIPSTGNISHTVPSMDGGILRSEEGRRGSRWCLCLHSSGWPGVGTVFTLEPGSFHIGLLTPIPHSFSSLAAGDSDLTTQVSQLPLFMYLCYYPLFRFTNCYGDSWPHDAPVPALERQNTELFPMKCFWGRDKDSKLQSTLSEINYTCLKLKYFRGVDGY